MNKKNIFTLILNSVFIVAFNAFFFLTKAYNIGASIWICYGFLHFSYLMILLTPVLETKGKNSYTSKLTTYAISLFYFFLELIFTLILYFKNYNKPVLISCINIVITAIYLITLMTNLLVNNRISEKQMVHDNQNDFIKRISAKARFIESISTDNSLKSKVNDLYSSIHSSPIQTKPETVEFEETIEQLLDELEGCVDKDNQAALDKITEINRVLTKRNLMLKV